mgnify:FL=1
MYTRKKTLDLDCPLRLAMGFIGSKWKPCLLFELRKGPLRPSQLHKLLKEAPPRVLNQTLKELEEDGFVSKKIYPELTPKSEYSITDIGVSFLPVIDTMFEWGKQYRDSIINTAK